MLAPYGDYLLQKSGRILQHDNYILSVMSVITEHVRTSFFVYTH